MTKRTIRKISKIRKIARTKFPVVLNHLKTLPSLHNQRMIQRCHRDQSNNQNPLQNLKFLNRNQERDLGITMVQLCKINAKEF